ncbi:hypothetical protein [Hymenobacter rubidus]|uniref:hypothetical protein n=1 Tax=Hymenobacter rubidus TaxID=1441626 RepID=UPI00191ECDA8|nr:hypothetical protein [Hymenobacter rubidus]
MQYIHEIIDALNKIEQIYIKLPAAHNVTGLIRERVFCYEFYHQMRQNFTLNQLTVISGEIDKRGYPQFKKQNPDFVFHVPGSSKGNALVCEVKGDIRRPGVKKDLESIFYFIEKQNYRLGLFIAFGMSAMQLKQKAGDTINAFSKRKCADRVLIVTIPQSGWCEDATSLNIF